MFNGQIYKGPPVVVMNVGSFKLLQKYVVDMASLMKYSMIGPLRETSYELLTWALLLGVGAVLTFFICGSSLQRKVFAFRLYIYFLINLEI
jgi:hypothetical protein